MELCNNAFEKIHKIMYTIQSIFLLFRYSPKPSEHLERNAKTEIDGRRWGKYKQSQCSKSNQQTWNSELEQMVSD